MKNIIKTISLVLGLSLLGLAGPAMAGDYVFAVSEQSPIASISKADLKKVLIGQVSHWPGTSTGVELVLLPQSSGEMQWLAKEFFGMPASAYLRVLIERVFQGKIARPLTVSMVTEAKRNLSGSVGGIAVLSKKDIGDGVKALALK